MSDWQYVDRKRLTDILLDKTLLTTGQIDKIFTDSQRDWRDQEIDNLVIINRAMKKRLLEAGIRELTLEIPEASE